MQNLRVAVLRGGPSDEYDISLQTGGNVFRCLNEKYRILDVVISRDGIWHFNGGVVLPEKIFGHIDVVFNALHGQYGEDGKIQKLLEDWNIPYTGSRSFPSAICMNKVLSKKYYSLEGIKAPEYLVLKSSNNVSDKVFDIFRNFPMPCIVKPVSNGSSIGISVAGNIDELYVAVEKARVLSEKILIEEFVIGREATCGVIENFRDEEVYPLMPVEISSSKESKFFNYDAKCGGELSGGVCPSRNFTKEEKETIQRMAVKAHKALGLRHYSRSDFIISPRRGIYLLETNSLPGLSNKSPFFKSLEAVGCDFEYFLEHLIHLAINKK